MEWPPLAWPACGVGGICWFAHPPCGRGVVLMHGINTQPLKLQTLVIKYYFDHHEDSCKAKCIFTRGDGAQKHISERGLPPGFSLVSAMHPMQIQWGGLEDNKNRVNLEIPSTPLLLEESLGLYGTWAQNVHQLACISRVGCPKKERNQRSDEAPRAAGVGERALSIRGHLQGCARGPLPSGCQP